MKQNTPGSLALCVPAGAEPAYRIAGEVFADYWCRITGDAVARITAASDGEWPAGDLVLIGSDAVNAWTHRLIASRRVAGLGIRYGTDDYRLLSVGEGDRTILIVAGGCGRSTLYGVYDVLRRRGRVDYFWDGDVFHHHGPIDLTNLDALERPHFRYRGLRYFAHRGAHRFFPEMWNLDEWKREIDWIVKRRFNLFMLRIGTDDLFQRAFDLPYPPEDGVDPDDAGLNHKRTALWPLRHRGKLREAVLAYARDRGLVSPEDTGAMTHWYTPTPSALFGQHPQLPLLNGQKTGWYDQKSELVWDVADDTAMDLYWKLTETHIREYGGGVPRLFHTIGLAERLYGSTDDENLQLKLHALRRTQEWVRRHDPDTPLIVAGWDLMMWWKSDDVRRLCDELDPDKTLIFDYNADMAGRVSYRECGLYRRFPWLFGLLHCFTFNNEMRGDYRLLGARLTEAAADSQCQGFLLWPELSHTDTFMLEFLAEKSWRPEGLAEADLVNGFCARRYPEACRAAWREIWWRTLRVLRLVQWGSGYPGNELNLDMEFHHRLLQSEGFIDLTPERVAYYRQRCGEVAGVLPQAVCALDVMLRELPRFYPDEPMRRDMIDIVRSVANLLLRTQFMRYCVQLDAWRAGRCGEAELKDSEAGIRTAFTRLADLLEQNDDFSLRVALDKLTAVHPVNPAAERVLKENASHVYCRNQTCEVVRHLYLPELDCYFQVVNAKLAKGDRSPFRNFDRDESVRGIVAGFAELPVAKLQQGILDAFLEKPLAQMSLEFGASAGHLAAVVAGFRESLKGFFDRIT